MNNYSLAESTLGYVTATDPSNTDFRLLVDGSKNVMIDFQKKVKTRSGYKRLGSAQTALNECRNGWTWHTSTGAKWMQRFYDDELEVYLSTVDGYDVNAWKTVKSNWSTSEKLRAATYFDSTENIDFQVMVNGDDNLYAWNGAVAIVDSVTSNTITKKGTNTFAQNRFFVSSNKTLINVRTGTEFTYTGGEDTTTLTSVTGSPVADGMVAGDVLIQKVVTNTDTPAADRNNHIVYNFENQIVVGSDDDEQVYISNNTDYTDFTYSSPRLAGEGALLTLNDPARGISSLGSNLLVFAGRSTIFKTQFHELDIGGTLSETLRIKKLDVGIDQGALNQDSIVPVGNTLFYLTNEVAVRAIGDPDNLTGINPKTFSNPIKPDFDAEDWYDDSNNPDAYGFWHKNMLIFTAPQGSHMYILNFVQDADGKLFRFWNPPQILPVGSMASLDLDDGEGALLYGFSNATPEVYELFTGKSDRVYTDITPKDKLPIDAKAVFAYNNYKKKGKLKTFDEYYAEGEIIPSTTELKMTLRYDYDGTTQEIEKYIDGSDSDILEGAIGYNSLAQQSLAINPLGGLLNPPSDARRFRVIFETAREDFFELQTEFSTNAADRYWAIITHGSNAEISRRRPTTTYK